VGILTYNSSRSIEMDDRTLAHVRSAMFAKLRRGESFSFSWERTPAEGSGRNAVWIDVDTPLSFEFFERQEGELNGAWIAELVRAANTPGGLVLSPEPTQP
jgi:hypothetical protein